MLFKKKSYLSLTTRT